MAEGKMYWGSDEEEAIKNYIAADTTELKHSIYQKNIHSKLEKLIENIYFTYNFNRTVKNYDYVKKDLLLYLYERLDKFDPTKGFKSFSYFGTIAKNWLIQEYKKNKNHYDIDDENKLKILHDISVHRHNENKSRDDIREFMAAIIFHIKTYKSELDPEDYVVLDIIEVILKEYTFNFDIFNKKQLYIYIREATNLPTRKITKSVKKIKSLYEKARADYMNSREFHEATEEELKSIDYEL